MHHDLINLKLNIDSTSIIFDTQSLFSATRNVHAKWNRQYKYGLKASVVASATTVKPPPALSAPLYFPPWPREFLSFLFFFFFSLLSFNPALSISWFLLLHATPYDKYRYQEVFPWSSSYCLEVGWQEEQLVGIKGTCHPITIITTALHQTRHLRLVTEGEDDLPRN